MTFTPEQLTWIFALGAGFVATSLGYVISRLVVEVPSEDRTYLDRPPPAFFVVWWPIQWIAFYLRRTLTAGYRTRLQSKLRLAGLDYVLSPEQFSAARIVLASALLGFMFWVTHAFNMECPAWVWGAVGCVGLFFPTIWLNDQVKARKRNTMKALPFFLDLITLCVEAGLNLTGALQQAVNKGPAGPLRDELSRILRDVRAGRSRAEALRTFSQRMSDPAITNLVTALIQAENTGMNLGPVLRAQADQRRIERFARAEKAAMEAPVKLLFPLLFFIFPCVFLVIGFPIAMKFLQMGL